MLPIPGLRPVLFRHRYSFTSARHIGRFPTIGSLDTLICHANIRRYVTRRWSGCAIFDD